MFNFFKRKKGTEVTVVDDKRDDKSVHLGAGFAAADSARASTRAAAQKFAKPAKYDRSVLDDGAAKIAVKINAFKSGVEVKDPYTGDVLTLTKQEAKMLYGENWQKHLAEADHKVPLEKRYQQTKNNPWLTNDDIKASSNSTDNLEVVSRKFNNVKRSRSNEEFVNDPEYMEQKGVIISKEGKAKAIESGEKAQRALRRQDFKDSARNIVNTGHTAGIAAATNAGITGITMSGIMNITAVIKGEKSAEDAVVDTISDSGKATVKGYFMGAGLTTVSHSLSGSSSQFIRVLSESNVPGKVITAAMVTGDTLRRYGNGEITTQECLIELGEKGLNFATTGYSMAVGQALIPIPVVGAAVGALVGSIMTSNYYNELITTLKTKELEHQERLYIIAECEKAAKETRAFRVELENYLSAYFREYHDCFNEALSTMHFAFQTGDADGVIAGANQITRKLGGKVYYDNMNEFKTFLFDDSTDVL